MNQRNTFEQDVQTTSRHLYARLGRHRAFPLGRRWWDERLMGLTTSNEALKVQLFRFVDTLPYLHSPEEVSRHLREYLNEAAPELPWWTRAGMGLIPTGGVTGRLFAQTARTNATRMARKFIAGSNLAEAVETVNRLRGQGLAHTIDLLGEATVTEAEADAVYRQYVELITGLSAATAKWPELPDIDRDDAGPIPRASVSVKLSSLYSQFDPIDPVGTARAVNARLRPLLYLAREHNVFVNFDMEQYSFKDTTLQIFRDLLTEPELRDWPHVGIAVQAYLVDTERDLAELATWARDVRKTPVWVRLVKGAYWDYETVHAAQQGWTVPVFTEKWQSDASFEHSTTLLFENHKWLVPAIASHNVRSIGHAMACGERFGVPKRRYEFQVLYGMADAIQGVIQAEGYRVRVYTPYGELLPGMAYLVRRLLENTSNDSFLKQGMSASVPVDVLLRRPEPTPTPPERPMTDRTKASAGPTFTNEPLTNFAVAAGREAMRAALNQVRLELGRHHPVVIDGQPVEKPERIISVNPSRHAEVVGTTGQASAELADRAVAGAFNALDAWRDTPVSVRAGFLRRAAEITRRRRFELAAWITLETGKPWREADADVAETVDFFEYYALEAEKLQGSGHRRDVPGEENALYYDPRGVAAVVAPWNFPLAILAGMASAALVTGNTVVMKPAEQSGVVGAKLMEVFQEAGVPPGVVQFLPGVGEEVGPRLVGHPDVALIAFTGSLAVALRINEQAAKTPPGQPFVKKVIAEMGGKNAVIVDSDADLDEAVRGVVDSAFGYGGQKCSAGSRAVVLASIYDAFMTRLVEATKSLTVAPADDPGCAVGPVIDAEARDRIERTIAEAQTHARLAYQHPVGDLTHQGYFVGPAIFADAAPDSPLAQEEIFGPVLTVLKARDLNEALAIANGTKYALTGGVYSRSPANLAEVRRRFRVGNLYVNRKCTGALVDRQPFGGFKLSGIGSKAGGPDYLLQFVVPRTVTENTMRRGFAPPIEEFDR